MLNSSEKTSSRMSLDMYDCLVYASLGVSTSMRPRLPGMTGSWPVALMPPRLNPPCVVGLWDKMWLATGKPAHDQRQRGTRA